MLISGPVPEGADSVVQVEDTELVADTDRSSTVKRVKITVAARQGQDIRPVVPLLLLILPFAG